MGATTTGEGQDEVESSGIALEVETADGQQRGNVAVVEISEAEAREFGIDLSTPAAAPEAIASVELDVETPAPLDPRIEELEQSLKALQDEHQALEARAKQLEEKSKLAEDKGKQNYERLVRATADLDNLKKRSKREVEEAKNESKGKIIREILPVLDNLERAMAHAGAAGDGDAKGIRAGVELVQRQFVQCLERCGVKSVDVLHTQFDPNLQEAVGQKETADHPPGTVVEVFQRGYFLGERLIRPALVVVGKLPTARPADADAVSVEVDGGNTMPTAQADADALKTVELALEEDVGAREETMIDSVIPGSIQPSALADAAAADRVRPAGTIPYSGAPTEEGQSRGDTEEES